MLRFENEMFPERGTFSRDGKMYITRTRGGGGGRKKCSDSCFDSKLQRINHAEITESIHNVLETRMRCTYE